MISRSLRNLVFAGLIAGAFTVLGSVAWLNGQPRPYPGGVQFRAPHQRTFAALVDRVWFRPYGPPILEGLRGSWLLTVHAQTCTTPICNFTIGEETNISCPKCGASFYWQNCVPSNANTYCSQAVNNCGCQRATNSKCNPPN